MKKVHFFSFFLLLYNFSCSQGINNLWLLGYNSGWGPNTGINIDFASGIPSISNVNRKMNFGETNGVICNKSGNLLFYSNGQYISNAFDDTMQNGSGLNPSPFTNNYPFGLPIIQGNLIIPFPGDTTKYYLFHETSTITGNYYTPHELFYSIINMSLDSSKGAVTSKNIIVIQDTLIAGELTATIHANGRDWWLLCHKVNSDLFYKLLISPYGITISSQNYGTIRPPNGGSSVFSPDGTKFAHYNVASDIDIYDFDRCTGVLSNYLNISINDSSLLGGVAFSSGNKVLYVSSVKYVYQLNLTAINIPASIQTIGIWDGFYSPSFPFATAFYLSQLAPDGKIYINCTNSTIDMHVINNPDSLGLTCDLQQHSVHLTQFNAFTIPNHPNYFLGSLPGSSCDSLTPIQELKSNTIPIHINPNPAQSSFYLNYELPYGKTAIATIYNSLGETVLKRALYWYFGYLQIDCSGLNNGVYFVKVETKGYAGSAKLVIAR